MARELRCNRTVKNCCLDRGAAPRARRVRPSAIGHLRFAAGRAISNCQAEPDRVLWSLAGSVEGWGRIHAVERLQGTDDEEIRDWMVRHGFRNTVMNEYLAWIAATTGRLAGRLAQEDSGGERSAAAG